MKMKSSGLYGDQSSGEWKFEWCHRRCKHKLQRIVHASERKVESNEDDDQQASEREDEITMATEASSHEDDVDQQASDCKDVTGVALDIEDRLKGDFDRQTYDCQNLPGIVEKHMTARAYHGSSFFSSVWRLCCNASLAGETPANKLLAVVKNRCQDNPGSGSANSVSKCFEINDLDLKMRGYISGRASKCIFRANWLEQEVAVAFAKHVPRDVVEKEAELLGKVHHPNVVGFFGFALKEEALSEEEMAAVEKIEPKGTGYLVMELMQEDLGNLIERLLRGTKKQECGGPFPLSITVDFCCKLWEP